MHLYARQRKAFYVCKLDVYEGTPHVFQGSLANTPESKIAMNNFLKQYLHY
jgi:epsilon-lactone hydrolase